MTAMITMSVAQSGDYARAMYPALTDLPVIVSPGVGLRLVAGVVDGALIALAGIPPFIATLGMMVTARGIAKWYTNGPPISFPADGFAAIGAGAGLHLSGGGGDLSHCAERCALWQIHLCHWRQPPGVPGLFVPVRCRGRWGCGASAFCWTRAATATTKACARHIGTASEREKV